MKALVCLLIVVLSASFSFGFVFHTLPVRGMHPTAKSKRIRKNNLLSIDSAGTMTSLHSTSDLKTGNTLPSYEYVLSQVPNALTIARMAAVPVIMTTMSFQKRNLSFLLFVLSSITDFLDGYLARKFNVQSTFGSFLDPVADKLLMASTLGLLAVEFPSYWYTVPVAIIMCREIAVSALREWMAERNEREVVKVGWSGKLKTALQMISVSLLLLVNPKSAYLNVELFGQTLLLPQQSLFLGGLGMLYVATVLTVYSGWQYFKAAWPLLTKN